MVYKNLDELIKRSRCGREYYYVLPKDVQQELQSVGEFIHTSDELHAHARFAEEERRSAILSHRSAAVVHNFAEAGHNDK